MGWRVHVEAAYFGECVHVVADMRPCFTPTVVQLFCAGGSISVEDTQEIISCLGYAEYYY